MNAEKFPEGKKVFSEGETGSEAYRIIEGLAEVSTNIGNHKVVLARLGPGEIFGEMGMIEQKPRSATVRAIEELSVEVITREDFNESLQGGGERIIPYLKTIFERLRVTNERLRSALNKLEDMGAETEPHVQVTRTPYEGPSIEMLPDSDETHSQTALQARTVKHFPFLIGRRGDVSGVGLFGENQLLISDRSPYRISREHCHIECESDSFYVSDNSSRLGTIVNGVGIGGPHKEHSVRLRPGENTLVLGGPDSQMRFKLIV